jgi:hypothetical protein
MFGITAVAGVGLEPVTLGPLEHLSRSQWRVGGSTRAPDPRSMKEEPMAEVNEDLVQQLEQNRASFAAGGFEEDVKLIDAKLAKVRGGKSAAKPAAAKPVRARKTRATKKGKG